MNQPVLALRTLRGEKKPRDVRAGCRQRMDGHVLLRSLRNETAALVFFDPQYREIMDRQAYGNEGARQKGRARLPQMTGEQIAAWMWQIQRVLKPSGHVVLWLDKFSLSEGLHLAHFAKCAHLRRVDLVHWNKLSFGMGARSRGTSEYASIAQKEPARAKGVWTDKSLRDSWPEQSDRAGHPHAKPQQLIQRIIKAVTKRGDLVVDPCAGGYPALDACQHTGRTFVGCDLI